MKTVVEKLKESRAKINIEVEPKELAGYFKQAFDKVSAGVLIEGFRPGKAPFRIVVAKVGYNKLLSEGTNIALSESYAKALIEHKITPISEPNVSVKKMPQFSLDASEIKDSMVITIELYIMPEVKLLDYKNIKIKKPKKDEAKEKDVEKIIDHLLKQRATFKEINRAVKKGDRAEINFVGSIKKVVMDKLCSKNFPLILGEGRLIPGFEDKIIGLKKGDKTTFLISFPNDYFDKEIAEKKVNFEVELIDVKEVIIPKLNDEFAKKLGQDTVKKLKEAILESLKQEIEQKYQSELEQTVIEKVLPCLKVELPEVLVLQEIDRMLAELRQRVESQGLKYEKYLESMKKTEEELKKDMRAGAEKNIRVGFLLGKIIKEQKIDTSDKEGARKAIEYLVKKLT